MKKWDVVLWIVIFLTIDQLTKFWMLTHLTAYHPQPIVPMLNFTLAFNSGSAFSFLSQAGGWHHWFFVVFSLCMIFMLCLWIYRLPLAARCQRFFLALILSGAIGNLIDRLRIGYVIDFIQVYYKTFYWPIFNIADSCICIGAFGLAFYCLSSSNASRAI